MMRAAALLLLAFTSCRGAPAPQVTFPDSWAGVWAGTLRRFDRSGVHTVSMELHIAETTKGHTWKLVYGDGAARQEREYLLRVVDAKAGEWEIDERNSIVLRAQMRGGVLISRYAVGTSDMTTVYRRAGDVILFELFAGSRQPVATTGGDGESTVVAVFDTVTRQEAALRRRR